MRFCIDPEDDYELMANLNYPTSKIIGLGITRCKASNTLTCKDDTQIDDFINNLVVITDWH